MSTASKDSSGSNGVGDDDNFVAPTAGEAKFFAVMFKHLPQNIDMDWDEFAKEMGLKDGKIAKVRCRQIRNKLGVTGAGTDNAATPRTPTKSGTTAKSTTTTPKSATPKSGRVTKPRKTAKAKQSISALEAAADNIGQDDEPKVDTAFETEHDDAVV